MSKLSTLALFACLAMTIVSTGADAAAIVRGQPKPFTPSNNDTCVVNCLQIVQVPHPDCGGPRQIVTLAPATDVRLLGTNTNNNTHVPCAAGGSSEFKACGDKLGNLRRVTVAQVRRIDDNDKVHLVPLCDIVHRSLTQIETTFLARGNVQGLILPISRNDTLMTALDDGGYKANDVLGIVRGQDMVTLYVSRAPH